MGQVTARRSRLLPTGLPAMLLVGGLFLLGIFGYAPTGPAPVRTGVLAAVNLVDDDGGAALFAGPLLVPGATVSRCLAVSYAGAPNAGTVHLAAADVAGPLAPRLRIRIEQGTGGGFASCAGFTGSVLYDGPLPALVDAYPAKPRLSTGWTPGATGNRSYRISVMVADEQSAQGLAGTATFRWLLVPTPVPTSAAPTPAAPTRQAPVAAPPTSAAPAPPTGTEPVTTDPVAGEPIGQVPVAPARPSAAPTRLTDAAPRAGDGARGRAPTAAPAVPAPAAAARADRAAGKDRSRPAVAIRRAVVRIARRANEVAVRTAQDGVLPAGGIGVLLAFLALQTQVDRRDPKLNLAPVEEQYLAFPEPETAHAANPAGAAAQHDGPAQPVLTAGAPGQAR